MKQRIIGFAGVAAAGLCVVLATTALAAPGKSVGRQTVHRSQVVIPKKVSSQEDTKAEVEKMNAELLAIQEETKGTGLSPAWVAESVKLVKQLRAIGQATKAQLAWLKLTPAEQSKQAAPVAS
ncbi:hypothetical protein [Streptomyces sp. NPDC101776]|uniref:hypothetical protein n=1 Tax=Streptomyces sp. NPDC101776 TaxID=3366146 RepID=UPI00381742B4